MAEGTTKEDRNSRRNLRRALAKTKPVQTKTDSQGYRRAASSAGGRSSGL